MADLDLQLLLPQGTITYSGATNLGNAVSTIDLVFSSACLAEGWILCASLNTDHGSNHAAIRTVFFMNTSKPPFIPPRQLFKSAPWNKILQIVLEKLYLLSASPTDIDNYANQLLQIVQSAIVEHVPLAKPSLYAKRWWCKDLTTLRKEYTTLRNRFHRTRRHNLDGSIVSTMDAQAWAAKYAYFKALRKRKKEHWEYFLDNTKNILQAAKYLSDQVVKPLFSNISRVKDSLSLQVSNLDDIANVLLDNFFPRYPPRLVPKYIKLGETKKYSC